ncbi:MAG: 2Fe-2S iron-sulfur cluster-binding protein [Myxococcota bacterium]|jgi:ferredoxin|nr:hypothetical protein [Deltaproteobacteria bacterium]MCP4240979.1 (2Fe-2S)-binding protein [bacterium]MDP6075767.1 2Fe-2S iron-sulfur cluster-binding protein [Myxococcota bacterium]MBT40614.1 hypothetical protein [Deltaproteobacteria bacterium]MDP6242622.1 2Fe-2S iron-sulfur cluster-binding protein [Myxococcota bacterium]
MDVEVRFQPSGRSLRVAPGTTLLEAAQSAGLPMASACGAHGVCGRCSVELLGGARNVSAQTPAEARVMRANRVAADRRLACHAHVAGPVEMTASYW